MQEILLSDPPSPDLYLRNLEHQLERVIEKIKRRKLLKLDWTTDRLRDKLGYLLSDQAFLYTNTSTLVFECACHFRDGIDRKD